MTFGFVLFLIIVIAIIGYGLHSVTKGHGDTHDGGCCGSGEGIDLSCDDIVKIDDECRETDDNVECESNEDCGTEEN